MASRDTIFIFGSGAIGFTLAAALSRARRRVVAVRTSRDNVPRGVVTIAVDEGAGGFTAPVETVSLAGLTQVDGMIVVTAKSYANQMIAQELRRKAAVGPVIVMQNGIGVEKPFIEAGFSPVYRCILYVTSQASSVLRFTFRPVTASPVGVVHGSRTGLIECVKRLSTDGFPFREEADIAREIWKKAIVNTVFNSLCPLLDVDNGIFARDEEVSGLARELIDECSGAAAKLGVNFREGELMEKVIQISHLSDGQLISTLQDIRRGRRTEIESLNFEIVKTAEALDPAIRLPRVDLLGRMILAKSSPWNAP